MGLSVDYMRPDGPMPVPPLSQSRYDDMACEALYVRKQVQGARLGGSGPAARGSEIHRVFHNAAFLEIGASLDERDNSLCQSPS